MGQNVYNPNVWGSKSSSDYLLGCPYFRGVLLEGRHCIAIGAMRPDVTSTTRRCAYYYSRILQSIADSA